MICWKCHKEIKIEKPVRGDECPLCHADLHVCKGCDFYECGTHNECRESSADFVSDKERSNFCDYFRVKKDYSDMAASNQARALFGLDSGNSSAKSKADAARDAFNSLFS